MKLRLSAFAALCAVLAGGSPAQAQAAGGGCVLEDNPTRVVTFNNRGTPAESWYITQAVFECPDGRRIVAQTATFSKAAGQYTLNGAVQVNDADRELTSEFAQYFIESGQVHARTSVVLREKRNGSVIMSELLDIYQETPEREALVIATGGRPRAILFQRDTTTGAASDSTTGAASDSTAGAVSDSPGSTPDSTTLEAQEIRIEGEQSFRGTGSAVMRRDSLTASGHAIAFSEESGRLDVMGGAHVELPSQDLRGDTIVATVDDEDQIDTVLARHTASLVAEDLNVAAPAIRLLFENGGVERLVAMRWDPPPGEEAGPRPHVESEAFSLDADSIDVLAPGQQITSAVAIGDARGERMIPDSLRALLPEAEPEVLALLSGDWMRGDTVSARFVPNPAAETDTTAAATIMEQLAAHGNQAQSMYSIRDENDPAALLSFNYLLSSYIEVNFVDGLVGTVSAAGDAKGIYLQPAEAARVTETDTVGVATTRNR
jgi:hypothetical protein